MFPINNKSSLLYSQKYPESSHFSWPPLLIPWSQTPLCCPGYCISLLLCLFPCSCPFTSYRPFSAEQLIPFSKVRPCHSSAQNPPKVCQQGAKATSFLGLTRHQRSGPTSTPLSLAHSCFSHTGFYCAATMPTTSYLRAFALAALGSSEMLPHFHVALPGPTKAKGNPSSADLACPPPPG